MVEIAHERGPMQKEVDPTRIVSAVPCGSLSGFSRSSESRRQQVRWIWDASPTDILKVMPMKRLLALILLVCSVLVARLIDVLATIFGQQTEAVDLVDAWFRNSDNRLLRWMSEASPREARPAREIQPG
jgi:hypothetical protein